jgi:hypothetical protein
VLPAKIYICCLQDMYLLPAKIYINCLLKYISAACKSILLLLFDALHTKVNNEESNYVYILGVEER